ncbi:hypothetical protein ABKN59_005707 [Abortiporus biennis]
MMNQSLHHTSPGTPAYFQSILTRIRDTHPDLPVDPVILQAILLCLIAGRYVQTGGLGKELPKTNKHLLLRTKKDDVPMVMNLTAMILTTIFGFPTHKSKLRDHSRSHSRPPSDPTQSIPRSAPDDFLRSLFFKGPKTSRLVNEYERDRRDSSIRRQGRHTPRRSSTFPLPVTHDDVNTAPSIPIHAKESTDDSALEIMSLASSRRPLISPHSTVRSRPGGGRTKSDGSPLMSIFALPPSSTPPPTLSHNQSTNSVTNGVLSKAVVVSGLEFSDLPAQRALTQVLSEMRLVLENSPATRIQPIETRDGGTWNLPNDFVFIYVCPLEASDRPQILRGLVDKFAMSVDVNIALPVRQAYAAYRTSHLSTPLSSSFVVPLPRSPLSPPHVRTPSSDPLPGANGNRTSFFRTGSHLSQSSYSPNNVTNTPPIITSRDLTYLRSLASPVSLIPHPIQQQKQDSFPLINAYTSIHDSLNLYLSDLFSAARHHPELDGTLLSFRAQRDATDLARAFRAIGGDTIGADVVIEMASRPPNLLLNGDTTTEAASSRSELGSLGWGRSHDDGDQISLGFGEGGGGESSEENIPIRIQAPDTPRGTPYLSNIDLEGSSSASLPPPVVWDVSEVDIARVFPRIVSHRLSVRQGPSDEILGSLMFPAAGVHPGDIPSEFELDDEVGLVPHRRSVKDILVGILADV